MGGKNLKQTEFLLTDKKVMTSFHTDGIIFLIVTVRITSGKGFPMRQFLNKSFLILYSLLLLCPTNTDRSFVVGFFLAVFTAMTTFFFTSRRYACSVLPIFLVAAPFYPALFLFFPVICYDLCLYRILPLFFLVVADFLFLITSSATDQILYILFGCITAILLEKHTSDYDQLKEQYIHTVDDQTEKNMLLSQKHEALLQKQDSEIYAATLQERNRIAREIHDNVGHMLSRAILLSGAIRTINKEESLQEPLRQLTDTLSLAMDNIRTSVHDLHDDSVNLKEVTEELTSSFTFCPITLEYDMPITVPRTIKYAFLSITKEALSNIIKHSNATAVSILMREHPALWQLVIQDNGTLQSPSATEGIGLENMKERIRKLNGTITFSCENGFSIFIAIPKNKKEESDL